MHDLFNAVGPKTEPEKALVVGYWVQVVEGQADFGSQQINGMLKDMGHGVSNITDVLSSLMNRRPSLVMQTKKVGTSRQARKRYRLTVAGVQEVERRSKTQDEAAK